MAGLLDFLLGQQGGGGLLGMPQQGGAQQMQMPQQGYGTNYMNTDTGGLLGSFRGALNQIANPQGLQQAYEQKDNQRAGMALLNALPGGQQQPPPAAPPMAPGMSPISNFGNAIAGIESKGQANPYAALGPTTGSGDQAYGKYQVMGANIPAWTKEHLGQEMTPQQFLANPQAQEAVFKGQFGKYLQQTGNPQDAASMWFTGQPLAQGANRADVNGMTGQRYVNQFTQNLGPQGAPQAGAPPPAQMAQAGPMAAPQTAAGPPQAPQTPSQAMAGSNLTLLDSPALQGMPDTVRRAIPAMLASKQYAPQAMAMIQKYINPEQWQMFRDAQGNVITRNTATGESKPLISATPDMQNAAASGLPTPLAYSTAQEFGKVAAQNTSLTPEQKNANASGGMSPLQFENAKVIAKVSAENSAMVPEQKLYQQAQAQGFVGSEMQFQAERARLLKQGQVSAEDRALTPAQKDAAASGGLTPLQFDTAKTQEGELAKTWVKKYEGATEAGTAAQRQLPQLAMVKNIVATDPNFYSGIGEPYNLAVKKIGVALGLDPSMAASQEVVSKVLSDQIVTGLRTSFGGLGQVRVAELNALQNALASKSNTPAALSALVTIAMKTQQRASDIADIAMNYDNGSGKLNAGYDRAVAEYDKTHPFLKPEEIANYKKIADTAVPASSAAGPDPAAIAEARRRGLIK